MHPPKAAVLDFNGTLSDDEPLLLELLTRALAEEGVDLDPRFYEEHQRGLSDPEVISQAFRRAGAEADTAIQDRVQRAKIDAYCAEISREQRIGPGAIKFVRALAREIPLAVASGAFAEEVETALELAGIREHFVAVVTLEDVDRGKPDPEGYELALAHINQHRSLANSIVARDALAVEDTAAGVAAARAAGLRCAAVGSSARAGRAADFTLERLDAEAAQRILGA